MRVAVIGVGRMGRFFAQTLAAMQPSVEVALVADTDATARAYVKLALGVSRALADPLEAVQERDIDAVVIATPTASHADLVIAAARAGKAIFCEKPLALAVDQTRAVLAVAEDAGVLLQVGFMRRFDPSYARAKELIDTGRIGRPVTFKAIGRDPSCPPLAYADPAHSGGLIVDMGIHDFDLARWLMSSEVESVSASGATLVCDELNQVGDIDNAVVNLRFTSGALGNVEVSRNARYGYDIRTEVLGSHGAVRIGRSAASDGLEVLVTQPIEQGDIPFFVRRFQGAYRAEIAHFVECVQHQRQPKVSGADALAAITIAEAATRSAQTGQPICIERPEALISG